MIVIAALVASAVLVLASVGTFLGGYWYQLLKRDNDDE